MKYNEMWEKYKIVNPKADNYSAWAFCGGGKIGDELAQLVLDGKKTATASSKISYESEGEQLPKVGSYSIILLDNGDAVCVIKNTKVTIVPFDEVSKEHAYKEGEGDRSLAFWRDAHRTFFTQEYESVGLEFDEKCLCVLEEFEVLYKV